MYNMCNDCRGSGGREYLCDECVKRRVEAAIRACRQDCWHDDMLAGQNAFIEKLCRELKLKIENTRTGDLKHD